MRRSLLPLAFLLILSFAPPVSAQTVEDGFAAYDAGDYEKAKAILLPLAEAGDPRAMNAVGLLYSDGKAYPTNPTTACDWYEQSAQEGYSSAQANFASCFIRGQGRPQDREKASFWAEQAARQGNVESQVDLVHLYHQENPQKAQEWGQKAADAGSVTARLLMEEYGLRYSGPRPTRIQVYCYGMMVGLLKKPRNYCDSIFVRASQSPP